jgi:hypothetical protein
VRPDAAPDCTLDRMTAAFPRPPKELAKEVANWGGNANWISKHQQRTLQFAEFVKHRGWLDVNRTKHPLNYLNEANKLR